MPDSRIVVRFLPSSPRWLNSLYIGNLIRGLQSYDVLFSLPANDAEDFLYSDWLRKNSGHVKILHFHWTHYHYTRETGFSTLLELAKFVRKIWLSKRYGYRIVWTMHNYMPHERRYPLLHYCERLMMAQMADGVIVHCQKAGELVQSRLFRRHGVVVIPLGSFSDFLPRFDYFESRRKLSIPSGIIALTFFGSIRPYKGVETLVQAFKQCDLSNLRLFIAGKPLTPELGNEIAMLALGDERISLRLEYVDDVELATLLSASDLAILPYRDILTSGAAITALGYGLPVIAPRIGCLPELVSPDCGLLYDPDKEVLEEVLRRIPDLDLARMRLPAESRAELFPWDGMVKSTASFYQVLIDRGWKC